MAALVDNLAILGHAQLPLAMIVTSDPLLTCFILAVAITVDANKGYANDTSY